MSDEAPLRVAVLGDLHGHFSLAYRVLRRWELETGLALDVILQVGDLGAFPPPFRLDKATQRFAEKDPDELGFAQYVDGSPEADAVLAPDAPDATRIDADLVFIRGNHEDFGYLAGLGGADDGPPAVDPYGRIRYLPNGATFTFERRGHALTLGALGGISEDGRPGRDPASPFYTASEVRKLRAAGDRVDVLLSHEPPYGAASSVSPRYTHGGSPEVLDFLREHRPRYHFCGHYHEPGQRLAAPGGTESWILHAVNFQKPSRLNPGCIGVLTWSGRGPAGFELLDPPWLKAFTKNTWRYL